MSDKKEIWIVLQAIQYGGTELHAAYLAQELVRHGWFVNLVCCQHSFLDEQLSQAPWSEAIKIFHTNADIKLDTGLEFFEEAFAGVAAGTLLVSKSHQQITSLKFLALCKKYFRKIIFIEQQMVDPPVPLVGWTRDNLRSAIRYRVEKINAWRVSRYASKVVAVSDVVRKSLIEHCWYPPGKVIVIDNATYPEAFQRDFDAGKRFRETHGIASDSFLFGVVARLEKVKTIDLVLRAFRHFLDSSPPIPVHLVICGRGTQEPVLRKHVQNFKLEQFVSFAGFQKDVLPAYSAIDSSIFFSRREGLPFALLESMACGCVPIVSAVGGMPGVVRSPDLGIVVPPLDHGKLTEAMHQITSISSREFSEMRQAVSIHVSENYQAGDSFKKLIAAIS